MLNKEKYAKEIAEIAVNCDGIALKDNKPISCRKIKCSDCGKYVPGCGCSMKKLTEWANSECEKSILDEAEKEYLSAVIEPFRKSVISIKKLEATYGWEIISFYSQNSQSCGCITILPPFESGTRFKGMELRKEYTCKELGL